MNGQLACNVTPLEQLPFPPRGINAEAEKGESLPFELFKPLTQHI